MEKISLTEHEQASIAGSCGAVPLASGARVAARGPELLRCLFAHWRHILRPDRAARVILAGRSWQAAGAVLLALVEINAVLLIEIGAPLADAWPVVVLVVLAFAWVAWVQLPAVRVLGRGRLPRRADGPGAPTDLGVGWASQLRYRHIVGNRNRQRFNPALVWSRSACRIRALRGRPNAPSVRRLRL